MTVADTVEYLGGVHVFGRRVTSELELADEVQKGFPTDALDAVARALQSDIVPLASIYDVVGSARTLQSKRQQRTRLSRDESERLARLARLAVRANEALGSFEKGQRWFGKPNRAFGGQRPLDLVASDAGSVLVEDVLERIERGVIS